MSTVGSFDRTKHFAELDDPLDTGSGFKSPATRKAEALANLGAASATALSGITALTNNTGGTVSNTIADVPAAYTEATLANQLASITAKINEIIDALN